MKEWLERNPNGSKDAFEKHFKALSQDEKKVCYTVVQTIHFVLIIPFIVTQKYKFLAVAAVRVSSLHPLALDGLTRVLL